MEHFGIEVEPIRERSEKLGMKYIREPIHDFDAFDVRRRLPAVIKTVNAHHDEKRGDKIYIHCTAGMGRAPSVATTYMTWIKGYELMEAYGMIRSKRPCNPKVQALREATADLVLGMITKPVTIRLAHSGNYKSVQIIGLDVGWGNKIDMEYDQRSGSHILRKNLLLGKYLYKFIIDGKYTYCASHPTASDGDYTNNWIEVVSNLSPEQLRVKNRLESEVCIITEEERSLIKQLLS